MVAAGDQGREALVEGRKVRLHGSRRDPHQDLADFHAIGVDRGLDVEDRRIVLRCIQHLVERPLALAFFQQCLVDRVFPVEVARQVLTGSVVIHHEQHIGIALGPAGELGKCRNVVVPHGARRDGSQKLCHVAGGVLQVLFQGRTQLRLLILKTRGQTGREALTCTGRKAVQTGRDFTPGLLELGGKFLTVRAQARAQIGFERGHRAPGQSNSHQHLHQKGDTQGNEHRPQQTAL
ncbi:hypothetical protein D9M71_417160 [compost metagenome]